MQGIGGKGTTVHTVLIVEDHELLATTLSYTLQAQGYDVHQAGSLAHDAVLVTAREVAPAVVLLDLDLGADGTSLPLIDPLHDIGARVLMLTANTDRVRLAECVEAGADGVLMKREPLDVVVRAVEDVIEEGTLLSRSRREAMLAVLHEQRARQQSRRQPFEDLTAREQEVLAALVEGKTAQSIADETFTSIRTVRGHIQRILDKLGVRSQLTAVAKAKEAGWPD